ncbi:MAG: DNA polymerase III subunit delta [Candidatus Cryptobacteroides sp.]
MAKGYADIEGQCRKIIQDARNGVFAPVYLLMGSEPYYPDLVCDEIVKNALQDNERDFNQSIYYGLDTDAGTVASDARSYPMMAERRLVVLKEAQNMKTVEDLGQYAAEPLESTVLVILMHGASADKRRSLYKNVSKNGVVLDSPQLRDYEMPEWISAYYKSKGLEIAPDAAALMSEYAGADLGKIALETDKMMKSLPEGTKRVTAADVEKNVGISREFSIFELTKELSYRRVQKALRIAAYIGSGPKFAMPMAVAPIFTHFYRILKYGAALRRNPSMPRADRARLLGVNPFFLDEYDTAVRNYSPGKLMRIISLLEEYDFKGKGGECGEAGQDELLVELVTKILA